LAKGIIFDIKRYAVHDGPGIRTTVFFKGCPLRCQWCHNPEGIMPEPEILINQSRCAIDCRDCVSVCPQDALSKIGSVVYIDRGKCDLCGKCVDTCAYEALLIAGEKKSANDVLEIVEKDRIFYDESDGGLTLSGGEPLLQMAFCEELLDAAKSRGVNTALDTSGHVPLEDLERIYESVDLFLYDIKIMDNAKHEEYTGVSNSLILDNLRELSSATIAVEIRIPLLAGVNDDERNIQETIQFLSDLRNIQRVSLLPYHKGGCEKYIRLRKNEWLKNFKPPSKERIKKIGESLSEAGFEVRVGG
jgi:pyruvate formate lyase activating enzyme